MQAMIFAAGMGTRLKPLTDVIPKALVPVGDKSLLQIVIERLISFGCEKAVVNVHHKAGQIKNFLSVAAPHFNIPISISDESEALLETGGGIRKASHLFSPDEPILIHNVDILSNVNLRELYDRIGTDDALLLVSERKTQRYLLFDDDMRLVGWTNISTGEIKSPYEEIKEMSGYTPGEYDSVAEMFLSRASLRLYAFSGIHIINHPLLQDMEEWPERFPIMDFYLNRCKDRKIRGVVKKDLRLLDVGKLDALEKINIEDWL